MPPPVRQNNNDYHYHAYDYPGAAVAGPWQLSLAQPARHGWQFYSMVEDLQGLAVFGAGLNVPNIALNNIGAPTVPGGRNTMELSFGSNAAAAPTVVITGGIHAREWVATEFVYLLAEYLVRNYTTNPQDAYQQEIHNLLNYRRIRIIPMLNPDGNDHTVFGGIPADRFWRKNRRALPANGAAWLPLLAPAGVANAPFQNVHLGPAPAANAQYDVPDYDPANGIPPNPAFYRTRTLANNATGVDLNRNLTTTAWGYDCTPNPPYQPSAVPTSDAYFGPGVGSEIETGNVQAALFQAANPSIASAIDYHSYSKMILFPSEAAHNGAVGADYTALGNSLHQLIRAQGGVAPDYQLGTPVGLLNYNATGSMSDHEAQHYQARAFTIELDPAPGAGLGGFDLPETQIRMVFEKNIRGALALISAPRTPATARAARGQGPLIALTQAQFFGWNVYGRGNQLP